VQQVGVDQARFLEMYERSVLPELTGSTAAV